MLHPTHTSLGELTALLTALLTDWLITDCCRCDNATERLMEYAATVEPKSKPTDVKKLGENSTIDTHTGTLEPKWEEWEDCLEETYRVVEVVGNGEDW